MISRLSRFADEHPARLMLYVIGGFTFCRLIALFLSDIDLGPDEAQYWWWSKSFEFGYFSKPPMIGWLIGVTTRLFGHDEWAVRLFSPLITAATTWLIFLITRRLYGARTALWAGVVWLTLPAITLSAAILSTDIPLLFFWSLGLLAFVRLTEQADWRWTVTLGLAIGFGMLSKYAMIYFPLCMALAFVLSGTARQALRPVHIAAAGAIAVLIFLPNVFWNAANDFQTLSHTQENASWGRDMFNFDELFEFVTAQFGVAGPIIFGALLWGLITLRQRLRDEHRQTDLLLLAFTLPPLLVICVQAFLSKANANWAMTTYPAGTILVVAWLARAGAWRWLQGSTALHAVLALGFMVASTNLAIADALGQSNSVKRVRYWEAQAAEIASYAEDYPAIVVDDRELMGNLLYYMRGYGKPIYAWDTNRKVEHHYEAFDLVDPATADPALLVSKYPVYIYSYVEYDNILPLGLTVQETNVRCPRQYSLFELSGYNPEMGPQDVPPEPEGITRMNGDCRPY